MEGGPNGGGTDGPDSGGAETPSPGGEGPEPGAWAATTAVAQGPSADVGSQV